MTSGRTPIETELAQALINGDLLDLRDRADDAKKVKAEVIRDLLLGRWPSGITEASRADPRGLRLRGATMIGRLDLDYLGTDIGLELLDCDIRDGITAVQGRLARLDLTGSTLGHPDADEGALIGDGLTVAGNVALVGVHAHSRNGGPTISMRRCHIGGQLRLRRATLTNRSGPALNLDGVAVAGSAFLDRQFAATGHGPDGAVWLSSGHIGGQLSLKRATLTNVSGPALQANRLTIDRDAFFDDGFTATGASLDGAVQLLGSHVGGGLYFTAATLTNESGPALVAEGLTVNGSAELRKGFTATGRGDRGTVRLLVVDIRQALGIDLGRVTSLSDPSHRLVVDGMTYRDIFDTSWRSWVELLVSATPSYAAQPYRQLTAVTSAAGHDSDTRWVLMEQRRDQLARAGLKRRERAWGWFTGLFLGYGYQAWRALIALLAVTLVSVLLMILPVGTRGLYDKNDLAVGCSVTDRIVLGVDTALPLITTPVGSTCLPRNNAQGQFITIFGVAAQVLGWAFATLFVAGFTGAVRKT